MRTSDGDEECVGPHCKSFRDAAPFLGGTRPLDYVVAVNNAMMGWPLDWDMRRMDECNLLLQDAVCSDVSFPNLPTGHTSAKSSKVGPPSRALAASGAQIAVEQEFRIVLSAGPS